jgi:predicted flap endonuclease-1-like 5' DNA nuclease
MMDWIEQYWPLAVLGALIILIALWWLIGSSKGSTDSAGRSVDQNVSPVISGPAITPVDVPPPSAAVVIEPEPEALVEPPIHPVPAGPPDELTRMKGVGPKVAALLNGMGVTRYDQIASWSPAEADHVDAQLGAFKGRVARDQWVEQARLLAAGDTAGYEAKFGKLG